MTTAGIILFALGAFLTLSNVYFSFVRYPIHLARGGTRETYRWVSGIPLFGSLLLWISIGLLPSTGFKWLAGILDLRHRGDSLVHWYDVVDRTVGRSFSRPQRLGIVPAGVNA